MEKTKFLILSDTHAQDFRVPDTAVDVAIHCGDLTEESKLDELRKSIEQLSRINAPLKLVIAGNHDFTLDAQAYKKKAAEATRAYPDDPSVPKKIEEVYGAIDTARQLFHQASTSNNIIFLDEGLHHFNLANGAELTVYASPFTPSLGGDGGFQFLRGEHHDFAIGQQQQQHGSSQRVDVVITHGPPKGVLDYTASKQRGGCEQLFSAVASARPRLHCFGHIHEGSGAKLVSWRGEQAGENPTHFSEIDNGNSTLVESLATLKPKTQATYKEQGFRSTSHCSDDENPITNQNTLFVNAAVESIDESGHQLPWVVDIELPRIAAPVAASTQQPKSSGGCISVSSHVPSPGQVPSTSHTATKNGYTSMRGKGGNGGTGGVTMWGRVEKRATQGTVQPRRRRGHVAEWMTASGQREGKGGRPIWSPAL